MRCSKCGTEGIAGKKFCAECGTPLGVRCSKCGSQCLSGAKFCADCGTSLNVAVSARVLERPPPKKYESTGERRHLTVMFCDLVGSTEISARLDPEEWREIEAAYLHAVAEAIDRFDGFVAKYLGDGVMAYFGWPEAHDNDAERAVRGGLAIIDAVKALNSSEAHNNRPRLSVRVGIDSGTVVIGKGGGSDSEVFGNTANVAARVQAAAAADTVVVTSAVHRLVSGLFLVEDRGAHQLKGIAELVRLHRIIGVSRVRSRLAASAARGLTPFVGRSDEIGLLWNRWERAIGGEGQVVFVAGEAGIGKSRIVRQFRERLAGTQHTWNECAGAAYFQNTPFYPIAEMVQLSFVQRSRESDEEKLAELERDLGLAGLNPAEAVPLVTSLLNISPTEKYPPLKLSAEQKRKRLLATLVRWVLGTARGHPLLTVLEDLHWFDASTLELIQQLFEQAATAPLMFVCTHRPEFISPWSADRHHSHLNLNRLSADDVRTMVKSVVAQSVFAEETVDRVVDRTGGVPLFIEELTRAVLEKGDANPSPREIPATLHDSLMARLDRLGPAKVVAQVASVIGREFTFDLLRTMSASVEDELRSALAKLSAADLIYSTGTPSEETYSFRHALIRDTAYEALLKSHRRELHRQIAVAMTETFPALAETRLEVVARHWTEADETAKAIAAWRKAGDAGFDRYAFKEAESAYRNALDLIRAQPESPTRDAQELETMNRLVPLLQLAKGWASPEAAEAIAYTQSLGEKTDNLSQHLLQVMGAFVSALSLGDLPAASGLAAQTSELAIREGSPPVLGLARVGELTIRYFRGDLSGAEENFLAGANLFKAAGERFPSTVASGFGFGSHVAWMIGRADTAHDRIRQAVVGAEELKSPFELAYAQYLAAMLHLFAREFANARASAAKSIALADEYGIKQYGAGSRVFQGLAEAAMGNLAPGMDLVRVGLDGLNESGAAIAMTAILSWIAVAQSLDGRMTEALTTIERALEVNPEELSWRPDAIRIRGELRRRVGQIEGAETDFRDAIALARKVGAKAWELRAVMSLVRMLRKDGNLAAGRDLLAPVFGGFTEGFESADLQDARTLMQQSSD